MGVAGGAALLCALALAGCGGTSSGPPATSAAVGSATPTVAPTATPIGSTAASCPTASEVGSALGLSLPAPTTIGTSAAGVACNYLSTSPALDVEVSIVHGIPAGYLSTAELTLQSSAATSGFSFTAVSGLGDQAYSYDYTLSPSGTALGIIAVKGTTFVGIACTMTSTTLSKVEAYAKQLLG